MMVYLPAPVVTAAMASFAGKPARCAGKVAKTLSIALGLVCFLIDFGTDDFLLFQVLPLQVGISFLASGLRSLYTRCPFFDSAKCGFFREPSPTLTSSSPSQEQPMSHI